ncbi:xanthine dehydrogenase molybdopterin binding subunit [Salinimonas marina]|uniref:Xanthine dehydrogenase molybdopterin binding subunit n=1 Tax=Salinimonas marina TaxID=2785918 RepID=A0A7S9HBZ5_9ALTE|nr:xanthine dehydrogenase molybdopterin binding subunit [Salinimonas marina]QPG04594.1 xanthine dehydrogenase molybdopterin binding subunit [Salinimonas marina]
MRKLTPTLANQTSTQSPLRKPAAHESAARQVAGSARYTDDIPVPANTAHAAVGLSHCSAGQIERMDLSEVRRAPGVIDVITVADIPGKTDIAPVFEGDPILADQAILFHGQPVFAVLADTPVHARQAATKGKLYITPVAPLLDVADALARHELVRPSHTMQSGDAKRHLSASTHQLEGSLNIGGQEHMYLEGQVALAIPEEEERMLIYSSSQHPSEVQKLVAQVLNISLNKVCVDMRRMGGGFGGKETQAAQWACLAAVLAWRNRCAVKLRLARGDDMQLTGKRHPFKNDYKVGFDNRGQLQASQIVVTGNCGCSPDLSDAIVDRAMFHADNAYYLGQSSVTGHRVRTNTVSNTAFRGFGGPQGMLAAEAIMDGIARRLQFDPLQVRKQNFYSEATGTQTHYGMLVTANRLPDIIEELERSSDYWERRAQLRRYNAHSPVIKKGLALTPVKFGISFTAKFLNQAGALVHVYTDGSIQVNHGGTEMGQGLHTKIAQIAAHEFGVGLEQIDITATRTDKVPNTSPTAASSGTDLNGKAVSNACRKITQRLAHFYAQSLQRADTEVRFADGKVCLDQHQIDFAELVQQAYLARVSLSATGFYKTPKIYYDREQACGRPFFYFAYGAAVSEVSIDTLTGEYTVDQVDIVHDVGHSLNPAIDTGQIEGAFIQGMGWLTTEDLRWDETGRLISMNMATYKIPAIGDTPPRFNTRLYQTPNSEDSIYHSKAVGEPPFMLAISVWCALKDAISSISDYRLDPQLDPPATPEKVLWAVMNIQARTQADADVREPAL